MRANLVTALLAMLWVVGCGGGGSSSVSRGASDGNSTPAAANVQAVTVDSGPTGVAGSSTPAVNTLYTKVTICIPGTTTCQDIDHIQVDTGSSGLRIIGTVLTLSLPAQKDSNGNVIAECVHFVDGSSWGPLRTADIKISGETASNLAIEVIGDPAYQTIPSGCIGTGTAENTVAAFGANGILGVGPFIQDCGTACEQAGGATYYSCSTATSCTDTGMALTLQVTNPVTAFAADNNGVIIELPAVTSTAASVSGSLIFGIGTQGNNSLGNAQVMTLNANGSLTTNYKTYELKQSFIDSGSNAYYFPYDGSIQTCPPPPDTSTHAPGFYCPATTVNLSATIVGANNVVSPTINFSVADANSLFSNANTTIAAAASLAAPSDSVSADGSTFSGTDTFDWGLPFYFGRNVYTAIEKKNTSAGLGPYFAF